MSGHPNRTDRTYWREVALAILCVWLLAPSAAHAGCGDHVRLMTGASEPTSDLPAPCTGPACQHNPTPAVPLSVPMRVLDQLADGLLTSPPELPGDIDHLMPINHDTLVSIHRPGDIFHPPRRYAI